LVSKELFEIGALDAGPLDMGYVRRLNTVMARRRSDMEKNVPATLADAINNQGALKRQAELVVFGQWLIDGSPGVKPRPGPKANPKKILKCVAAIMAEIKLAALKKKHARKEQGRESRKREITKHALADQWKHLFDEKIKASNFDAPLRSIKRILSDYLRHLRSGSAIHAGAEIKKSPEIKRALHAITGMLPVSQTDQPAIFTEPDVPRLATLVPFEIALEYQSDAHAEEHRRLPSKTKLKPRLRYATATTTAASPSGRVRADRKGTVTLAPEVSIRRDYEVEALIDRVVILVETRVAIGYMKLRNVILKNTGIKTFVHDLLDDEAPNDRWGAPLMRIDETTLTGSPFAIMIQEPKPEVLAAILKAIKDGPGIIEPVKLHLIETSVDFYPKKPCTPEEAVLRRERMVGFLQRHHWTRPTRILEQNSPTPRYADARQIHDQETEHGEIISKYRYLFAHEKSSGSVYRNETDSNISDREIRNRILTTRPGYPLMLNGTLVKGGKSTPHMISIQNKIADRRNLSRNTYLSLPDDKRRARMEVTISGTETLQNYGLHTIEDLRRVSFRKLAGNFLRCRLPMIEQTQHIFEDARAQMRNRGVYGVNLRLRALAQERRLAVKQAGGGTPRKTKDEELGLADWKEMNDVIGAALDSLHQRWSSFTTR
jgi:hypothetical protein